MKQLQCLVETLIEDPITISKLFFFPPVLLNNGILVSETQLTQLA